MRVRIAAKIKSPPPMISELPGSQNGKWKLKAEGRPPHFGLLSNFELSLRIRGPPVLWAFWLNALAREETSERNVRTSGELGGKMGPKHSPNT